MSGMGVDGMAFSLHSLRMNAILSGFSLYECDSHSRYFIRCLRQPSITLRGHMPTSANIKQA